MKRVGKSRWDGVSVVPCNWRQEFASCQLSRGEVPEWQSTETRLAARPGGRTEHGLTGHELVGPVPFLLIVMQCPQIDDNICALVNGKLADAAREGKERGVWNIVLPHLLSHLLSPESPQSPRLGKRAFYVLTPTPSSFSQLLPDSVRIQLFSSPLFLTCTYV